MSELEVNGITHLEQYNKDMSRSLIDKMFFMDKIDDEVSYIFDYGCADGSLIHFLAMLFPTLRFVGYDLNKEMTEKGKQLCAGQENVFFFNDLSDFYAWAKDNFDFSKAAINLSSLIHEVYSYCNEEEIKAFWDFVSGSGFRYIITRDMCLDDNARRPALKEDVIRIRSNYDAGMLKQFERLHGPLTDNYNLIHFLLKYRYRNNWQREVAENYLPLSVSEIAAKIGPANYELIYFDHYILPFLARVVKRDFGITLKDYTHIKFIYKLV